MKKNIYKILSWTLLAILGGFGLYILYKIHKLDILRIRYELMIMLLIITLILTLAALIVQRSKKFKIIAIVLITSFGGVFAYGSMVIDKAENVLSSITEASDTSKIRYTLIEYSETVKEDKENIFGMVESKDLPEIDMTTLKDKTFGILEVGNVAYNKEVVKEIREQIGAEVDIKPLFSMTEAYDMFVNKEIDILILNESIKSLFEKDIDQVSNILKIYEYENKKTNIRNGAEVTKEAFVVYVSGIDIYGPLSYESRSDVNKIMVVNPVTRKILLIDIPRDYYVPLTCIYNNQADKLTHSGAHGIDCTVSSIAQFFDIDINYYTRVNFTSLVEIVDALGGIEVYSDFTFDTHMAAAGYHFDEGINYLDGMEALMFSRERYAFEDGDTQRVKNQAKVLSALVKKATSPAIITKYMDFMDVIAKTIETNMTNNEILDLIQMQLSEGGEWQIESFVVDGVGTTDYSPDMGMDLYVVHPDLESVETAKQKIAECMNEYY